MVTEDPKHVKIFSTFNEAALQNIVTKDLERIIQMNMAKNLYVQIDEQLISGNGTGNNFNGINTEAQEIVFTVGGVADTAGVEPLGGGTEVAFPSMEEYKDSVENATRIDVLKIIESIVRKNNSQEEVYFIMNETTATKLELIKTANDETTALRISDEMKKRIIRTNSSGIVNDEVIAFTPSVMELHEEKNPVQMRKGYSGDGFRDGVQTLVMDYKGTLIYKSNASSRGLYRVNMADCQTFIIHY